MRALWNEGDLELIAGPNRKGEAKRLPIASETSAASRSVSSSALHGGPALSSSVTSGEAVDVGCSGHAVHRLSGRPVPPRGRPASAGDVMLRDLLRVLAYLERS
jgi:hypothetical protein